MAILKQSNGDLQYVTKVILTIVQIVAVISMGKKIMNSCRRRRMNIFGTDCIYFIIQCRLVMRDIRSR